MLSLSSRPTTAPYQPSRDRFSLSLMRYVNATEMLAEFGPRLARLRLAMGFEKRPALAELVGLDADSLRQYEQSRNFPSPYHLMRLAETLNATTDYLLFGEVKGLPVETHHRLAQHMREFPVLPVEKRGPASKKKRLAPVG